MAQCEINDCQSDIEVTHIWVTWYDGWQVTRMCPSCAELLGIEYGIMTLQEISVSQRVVPKPTTP